VHAAVRAAGDDAPQPAGPARRHRPDAEPRGDRARAGGHGRAARERDERAGVRPTGQRQRGEEGEGCGEPHAPQSSVAWMRVFVGLGANLGDREGTLRAAVRLLGDEVVAVSRLRETEPWGPVEQPPFLNGAALLETELSPRALLDRLLEVERRLGRTREGPRYGPRTIDLDLLLYGDAVVDEPGLQVPHPRLHERAFALEPLLDLDPDVELPGRGRVSALLAELHSDACRTSTSSTSSRPSSSSG
jgi:2-amino-4-hydroxy-6-hydroxymethyldihydropteridine diphosphokinase